MSRTFLPHVITDDSALGGSVIEKSLRFSKYDNAYLSRTPSAQGDRRVFTLSWWMKLGEAGVRTPTTTIFSAQRNTLNPDFQINLYEHALIIMGNKDGNSSSYMMSLVTEQVFRDPNAWYHCVVAFNTNQSTSSDRIKIYINGSQVTDFAAGSTGLSHNTYPSSGDQTSWGTNEATQNIGRRYDGNKYFDGYLAEINYVDGSQLDASSFGYTEFQTGLWRPKRYTGGYGDVNNGFHLDFIDDSSTSALGKDTSGNENDFTTTDFSVTAGKNDDSLTYTPTNKLPTFNRLYSSKQSGGSVSYREGNLKIETSASNSNYNRYPFAMSSPEFAVNSGKWYVEFTCASTKCAFGVCNIGQLDSDTSNNPYGAAARTSIIYTSEGQLRGNNSDIRDGNGSFTTNDIIGIALDLDNMKIYFHKNGTYINSGNPNTGANPDTVQDLQISSPARTNPGGYVFQAGSDGLNNITAHANFGQRAFSYSVPTGYKTLTLDNLPDNVPSITRPQRHFDVATWTGNNTAGRLIPLEFKPDFVWVKCRSAGHDHQVTDSVRGSSKALSSNLNEAEKDWDVLYSGNNKGMGDYVNGGFILDDDGNNARYNNTGQTYVAWCWKAGGAAVSNTEGNITSSVSVNDEAGFSIVSYTGNGSNGQTVGHGLSQAPQWIILKNRDATQNWRVWHHSIASDGSKRLILDQTNPSEDAGFLNDTAPTSTVFTLGDADDAWNVNGNKFIAYCWYGVPGYSQFGMYTGSGSEDGSYVHLGFKPAFLLLKRTDDSKSWVLFDNKRSPFNLVDKSLYPNRDDGDNGLSNLEVDFLSNGFKIKNSVNTINASDGSYVYMAFADQQGQTPFNTFPNAS